MVHIPQSSFQRLKLLAQLTVISLETIHSVIHETQGFNESVLLVGQDLNLGILICHVLEMGIG
jgi:hypothetical protein